MPKRPGPPQRPRQDRSVRTRARILEAALELLAEGGPSAVTHRAVAERAGSSVGSVTYHFATKVDLLHEVYRLHLSRVRERARTVGAAPSRGGAVGASDRARFATGLFRYLEQGVRDERVASLATFELALERARDPALRRRLRAAQSESSAFAAKQLAALGSASPEVDSALLIAALDGLRLAWLSHGGRSEVAKRMPALVTRLAELLGPPGEPGGRARRAR